MDNGPDTGAIRHRYAYASPGPWQRDGDAIKDRDGRIVAHWMVPGIDARAQHRLDAEYLAHCWQDTGDLLEEIERLHAELDAARSSDALPDPAPVNPPSFERIQALVDLMSANVAATGSTVPPGPLDLLPDRLRVQAEADAAAAHDHASHAAEDAFFGYLEEPTPEQAVATEYAIATLRYEWEVLVAAVKRLLADRGEDRRVGRWLYENLSTGTRISLGEVSEWPWLLDQADAEASSPGSAPAQMSPLEQRTRLRTRAAWLAQLGLSEDDPAPVDIIEEVANATLALLDEVERERVENDRLKAELHGLLIPDAAFGSESTAHGPVAQERNDCLAVVTGVPYTIGGDGSRHYGTEVARRLDSALWEMTASGNRVSVRAWTDIAGDGNDH